MNILAVLMLFGYFFLSLNEVKPELLGVHALIH